MNNQVNTGIRKSMEPFLKDDIEYYEHQITGVRQMMQMRNFLLADDMGLGKSLQALTVAAGDIVRTTNGKRWAEKIIIVSPVTLKANWSDEIDKFTRIPHVIFGQTIDPKHPERLKDLGPAKRDEQIDEFAAMKGPRALIVNYEQVNKHITDINRIGFDIAIFDEAHYLKNPKAQRTKACHKIRANRYFMLTGTPMLNQVNELWGIMHLIDRAAYPKYWSFQSRYCNTPDAPIWMWDGSFKPISEVKQWDEVVGWETPNNSRKTIVKSTVLQVERRIAPMICKVTMQSGQVIRCTPDHIWLGGKAGTRQQSNRDEYGNVWTRIVNGKGKYANLSRVVFPTPKLTVEQQRAADWLAGIYDGEGSGGFIAQSKSHNAEICQRIAETLDILGISYSQVDSGFRIKGGRQTYVNLLNWTRQTLVKQDWLFGFIHGGKYSAHKSRVGQFNRTMERVVNIEYEGSGEVISMQTSSGNYVAWGLASKNCVFGGWQNRQIVGVKNEKELNERLNHVMIRRLKKNVLDLPEVQTIVRKLSLSNAQQKLYNQVESELQIVMPNKPDPSDIENALTKLLRLKQICGTTLTFTSKDDSAKLDAAVEDAIELIKNGNRVVVFTQFRDVQEAFCERLDAAMPDTPIWELHGDIPKHDRQPTVNRWSNDPKPGAIVCMLQVAGIGLNMVAAQHCMFLDKLWVPGLNQQAIDRLHRIGQSETQPVQVLEYHMKGTIETRIEYVLKTKSNLFGTVVNDVDFKQKLLTALRDKAA